MGYIIPKLSSACNIMSSIKPFMSLKTLKIIYCSYFNAIISYGLPFWRNTTPQCKNIQNAMKLKSYELYSTKHIGKVKL